MTHALKTYPEYFKDIELGIKKFELRKDDRDFKVGDVLLLQEYNPVNEKYTGKELSVLVEYILRNAEIIGLIPGFCIMGIREKDY